MNFPYHTESLSQHVDQFKPNKIFFEKMLEQAEAEVVPSSSQVQLKLKLGLVELIWFELSWVKLS